MSEKKMSVDLDATASQIMIFPVLTLNPDWSLIEAVRFFLEHRISGAPVVGENGKPVGVLTLKDISRFTMWHLEIEELEDESPVDIKRNIPRGFHLDRMNQTTVRQVMSTPVKTIGEHTTIEYILNFFNNEKVHRIYVEGKDGSIAGVISVLDLVKWLKKELF